MKRFLKPLLAGAILLCTATTFAQQMPPAPLDKDVRVGKLDNGLTYYIRHNEFPKGQANFHIAQKVGAVQEEDNQNGLAHFLEHMCFNGTQHFPDKTLLNWLESIGVKFGVNLNAHTYPDQTIYDIINVPVARTSVLDSCLLILHDWADGLTLDPEEINKERGVIHEEWRSGSNAFLRILEKHGDELYSNSKYGKRLVIGKMDIIDNFPPQLLRDYYEKWYRPDLQGIIVVGDIDVDRTEQKIKEMFSPIRMPDNPAKFEYYPVPDNDAPILVAEKDKEMPANLVMVMVKYDLIPREMRNTDASFINNYINQVFYLMMGQRLSEIALKPGAPFGGCMLSLGEGYLWASTKGALSMQAYVNDKGYDAALKAALTELKKVKEYGFTASEYERARTEYMSQLEKAYNNRTKEKNDKYAQAYIANFIRNEPIPGIEYEYNKMKQLTPMLPVEVINQYAQQLLTGKNLVVLATGPDKEETLLPTKEDMQKIIDEVAAAPVEAYKDNAIVDPLMSELPTPGKIISETENKAMGYTELTLSNGAKVLLKPTTYKDNEIVMKAASEGGASLYPAADYPNIALISNLWGANGVSKFTINDLQKILSGKQAQVQVFVDDYNEGMKGSSTPKDLETMMQLLYLNFTQPRYDKEGFEAIKQLAVSQLKNLSQNPNYVFQDSLVHIYYGNHPKAMIMGMPMLEKLDYDRMSQIYKERFGNAADFTFIFSGNFDKNVMRNYVEQYIASLPSNGKKEQTANDGKEFVKGKTTREFNRKTENNQAMLAMLWHGAMPYTLENRIKISIAAQLMANELLNRVREDEGAAYSPYSYGKLEKNYAEGFTIQTMFGLNPDKRATSEKLTVAALEDLATNIPEAELNKMKEFMLKQTDENFHDNNYWVGTMEDFVMNGLDMATHFKETLQKITTKEMQDFVAGLLNQGNRIEVFMMPEK